MDSGNSSEAPLLYVSHLKKYFNISSLLRTVGKVRAVDDVEFAVNRGETFGIVGETGCGKTTLGRTILRLMPATEGDVYFDLDASLMNKIIELEQSAHKLALGEGSIDNKRDLAAIIEEITPLRLKYSLTKIKKSEFKKIRASMQPVFQDPYSSLDPSKLIKDIIAEPMRMLTNMTEEQIENRLYELIETIGLNEDHLFRLPHELSGGQRQRIGIARAISIRPKLLILDEPTSALDVSVQAQILNMLNKIQKELHLSYVFISHHLNVVEIMSDRVAVMYLGKVVELANTKAIFKNMLHPYTKALFSAIPSYEPNEKKEVILLEGEMPSPASPPTGCHFHTRCREVLVNCGWSPQDLSPFISEMFERTRNPEARDFPSVVKIEIDNPGLYLDLQLAQPVSNKDIIFDLLDRLIKKEQSNPNGIRFRAIYKYEFSGDSTIRINLRKFDVPSLKEYSKDHYVSCLIYEQSKQKDSAQIMKPIMNETDEQN